ncbi:MAG: hypothetical protein KAG28_10185 [Cocleimonas sp.]|nr:hypothetical protein [Cocleimonas sp.]
MKILAKTSFLCLIIFSLNLSAEINTAQPTKPTPASHEALLKEADKLWADKKVKEATSVYKAMISQYPEDKTAYQRLAGVYLLENKSEDAVKAYKEAILRDPENAKLFASMSIAYLHLSKYGMAKAMASEAIRLDPSMKSVNKIILYTDKKQAVIKQATQSGSAKMPDHGGVKGKTSSAPHQMPAHGAVLESKVPQLSPAHSPVLPSAH